MYIKNDPDTNNAAIINAIYVGVTDYKKIKITL